MHAIDNTMIYRFKKSFMLIKFFKNSLNLLNSLNMLLIVRNIYIYTHTHTHAGWLLFFIIYCI